METLTLSDGTVVAASTGDDDDILAGLALLAISKHPTDPLKSIVLLLEKMHEAGYRIVKEV